MAESRTPMQMAPARTASGPGHKKMDETGYLSRTLESVRNLRESLAQIERGQVVVMDTKDLGIDV